MQRLLLASLFAAIAAIVIRPPVFAGTLDDAPFHIVVPSSEWQNDDSTAQAVGKDVFIVATISNTNTLVKSVIIKSVLKNVSGSALEEFIAGIRDSFSNPAVKEISEKNTSFVGYNAIRFSYEVTQGDQTTYNETIVFIAKNTGWTIVCVGRPDQKDEIKKISSFYRKKSG